MQIVWLLGKSPKEKLWALKQNKNGSMEFPYFWELQQCTPTI